MAKINVIATNLRAANKIKASMKGLQDIRRLIQPDVSYRVFLLKDPANKSDLLVGSLATRGLDYDIFKSSLCMLQYTTMENGHLEDLGPLGKYSKMSRIVHKARMCKEIEESVNKLKEDAVRANKEVPQADIDTITSNILKKYEGQKEDEKLGTEQTPPELYPPIGADNTLIMFKVAAVPFVDSKYDFNNMIVGTHVFNNTNKTILEKALKTKSWDWLDDFFEIAVKRSLTKKGSKDVNTMTFTSLDDELMSAKNRGVTKEELNAIYEELNTDVEQMLASSQEVKNSIDDDEAEKRWLNYLKSNESLFTYLDPIRLENYDAAFVVANNLIKDSKENRARIEAMTKKAGDELTKLLERMKKKEEEEGVVDSNDVSGPAVEEVVVPHEELEFLDELNISTDSL